MVAALGVRHHILAAEKHITESTLCEHGRLVREVGRLRVAAFTAAQECLGMNGRAEFHRRDETVADRSIDFPGFTRVRGIDKVSNVTS